MVTIKGSEMLASRVGKLREMTIKELIKLIIELKINCIIEF